MMVITTNAFIIRMITYELKLTGYNTDTMHIYIQSICNTCAQYNIKMTGPVLFPTRTSLFTLLRSPHVHKKAQEQFNIKVHKQLITLQSTSIEAIQNIHSAILQHVPAGIAITVKTRY